MYLSEAGGYTEEYMQPETSIAFLKNEKHSFLIAKSAMFVQSTLSLAIIGCLLRHSVGPVLVLFLYTDTAFVILHLSYRLAYRGPKKKLPKKIRGLLISHSVVALLSLFFTFQLVRLDMAAPLKHISPVLLLWVATLILGWLFFIQKYKSERFIEERL